MTCDANQKRQQMMKNKMKKGGGKWTNGHQNMSKGSSSTLLEKERERERGKEGRTVHVYVYVIFLIIVR